MLLLGQGRQRTCNGFSRREFLQIGGCSLLGLSLSGWLRARAEPSFATGRARSVIFLWLWGGPAQLDTWDPKPAAPLEFRGPFGTIATRLAGVRFGELFPQIANLTDKIAVLRSLHTASNDHGVAGTVGLTGSDAGAVNLGGAVAAGSARPAIGAVVARARGLAGNLPPFMVVGGRLHQGKRPIIGEGGGPLGPLYDPFRLQYDLETGATHIPALQLPPHLTPERLHDRAALLDALHGARRTVERSGRSIDDYRAQALALLTRPEATRMFDLTLERPEVIDRYGRTRFGQSCLLARRLVEHHVPFVQVNWSDHVEAEEDSGDGGWDHHYRNFQLMQDRHAPWLDQAYSALIRDLDERGLLATTLVVAVGEFGRTPRINDKAGRDHWEHCYSALIAGGGVQGGRVIGESDARAERPRAHPLTPGDLAATVHQAVGVTSETAATLGVVVNGRVIEGLF
ncbi:MAG: DUF1501 domain-containing protein [Gemmataceae bacterium]